ncbi:hypothetical protein [Sphingomonas pseudosanguinis]|uniref:Uncharacterized protein n=1 Tax=Sphingomonas pseudosanguinis TaxID=413712 RepID=A0A7W6A9A1_9SPHN|nr:hypothetical protein [Sphingomonas pseudosanguinis]MBB3877893.1 hypothetical protein [Sphingomonas pseudosanguinis]MBN3537767.1 hypothetical protein [Sphingomonas pseudosanguinis]
MIWLRTLLGRLKGELRFILLLAVVIAGAWLYVQARHAERDRDDVLRRAELVCAAVGIKWTAKHMRGPGEACADRARQLRADREAIDQQSVRLLTDVMRRANAQASADAQAARAALAQARAAETRMEAANGKVEHDTVGADWFAALSDLAGLRRPAR